MIQVAIVEDEQRYIDQLKKHLDKFTAESGEEFHIQVFQEANLFIENYKPVYDVVFMDIMLPDKNGMEVAQELREKDEYVTLVFATSMAQFAVRGYAVNALDFIIKPVSYHSIARVMKKVMQRMVREEEKQIVVRTGKGIYRIQTSKILYIEVQMHHTIFHTQEGIYDSVGSLKKIEEELGTEEFIRCNSGCLVNLRFVKAVEGENVTVGEDKLPISRAKRKEFLIQLSDYFEGGR